MYEIFFFLRRLDEKASYTSTNTSLQFWLVWFEKNPETSILQMVGFWLDDFFGVESLFLLYTDQPTVNC